MGFWNRIWSQVIKCTTVNALAYSGNHLIDVRKLLWGKIILIEGGEGNQSLQHNLLHTEWHLVPQSYYYVTPSLRYLHL